LKDVKLIKAKPQSSFCTSSAITLTSPTTISSQLQTSTALFCATLPDVS